MSGPKGLCAAGMALAMIVVGAGRVAAVSPASSTCSLRRVAVSLPPEAPIAQLYGVEATSDSDAWAVGYYGRRWGRSIPLAEHWDGATWSAVTVPGLVGTGSYLSDVSAISSTNVWAIGGVHPYPVRAAAGYDTGSQRPVPALQYSPLMYHWNGVRWKRLPLPPMGGKAGFTAIHAVGPGDVWAVGEWLPRTTGERILPLFMHWDGRSWDVQHPDLFPDAYETRPSDVTIGPSSTVLAVGLAGGAQQRAMYFRASPVAGSWIATPEPNWVYHVSGDWGVGGMTPVPDPDDPYSEARTISAYRLGPSGWDLVATPPLSTYDPQDSESRFFTLLGTDVVDLDPSNAWLVGNDYYDSEGVPFTRSHVEHWNGTNWDVVPFPEPSFDNWPSAVDGDVASGAVYVVGGVRILGDGIPHGTRNRMLPLVFQGGCA